MSTSPKWIAGEQLLPNISRWLGDSPDRHSHCLVEVRGQLLLLERILWRELVLFLGSTEQVLRSRGSNLSLYFEHSLRLTLWQSDFYW